MTINLLGGLALFLYGMQQMTDGLKAAAGKQMNVLLAKLTGNSVSGDVSEYLKTYLARGPGSADVGASQAGQVPLSETWEFF